MFNIKKEWVYLALILTILIVFFNKILFFGQIFLPGDFLRSDTLQQNLPFKYTLYQSLKKFSVPLWTDKIFGGYPLFAEGQTGTFYPFNFAPFLFLPFIPAYNLSLFLNFIAAAVGMFFLAKSFKLSPFSSVIPAITFSLSSFFILHITHQNIVSAACWLPLLLLALKHFFATNKKRYAVICAFLIALQIFAGSFQITFYSLFILLLFLIIYFHRKLALTNIVLKYVFIIVFALLLSSIQLIPSLILLFKSTRETGLGSIALDSLPYHPRNLISFLFPYIYGDPGVGTYPHFGDSWGMFWENTGYIGIVSFFISLWSLFLMRQKKEIKSLWLIVITALLLALGKYGPLFWVYYLPGFNFFRVTGRFILFAIFGLTLLTGFTIDAWIKEFKNTSLKFLFAYITFTVIVIDLFLFGYNYNPVTNAKSVLEKPEMVTFLERYPIKGNVFSVADFLTYDEINKNGWRNNMKDNLFHRNSLGPDVNMLWGIKNTDGYSGLYLKDFEVFKERVYQGIRLRDNSISINKDSLELLGKANTQFLISSFDLTGEKLEKKYQVTNGKYTYKLYENYFYLPKQPTQE